MDYGLLLPPGVRERMVVDEAIDQELRQADALNKAIKQFDPEVVGVVFVRAESPEMVMTEKGLTSVKPGRWHVRRRSVDGRPDTFRPIETPEGGYRSPDWGVLHALQQMDTWHGRNTPDVLVARSAAQRKAKENSRPDMREEMASDIRAARRVAGENLHKRNWGKGKPKGIVGG